MISVVVAAAIVGGLSAQVQDGQVSVGMTEQEVVKAVGQPQRIVNSGGSRGEPDHIWEYRLCNGNFPSRGSLYIDDGRVTRIFGFKSETHLPELSVSQRQVMLDEIDQCPGLLGMGFEPERLAGTCNMLMRNGKGFALRAIQEYSGLCPRPHPFFESGVSVVGGARDNLDVQDYRAAVLLWALFPPEINKDMPECPVQIIYPAGRERWAARSFPLRVIDNVPLMICGLYLPEDCSWYQKCLLDFCARKGWMRRTPLSVPTDLSVAQRKAILAPFGPNFNMLERQLFPEKRAEPWPTELGIPNPIER